MIEREAGERRNASGKKWIVSEQLHRILTIAVPLAAGTSLYAGLNSLDASMPIALTFLALSSGGYAVAKTERILGQRSHKKTMILSAAFCATVVVVYALGFAVTSFILHQHSPQ